EFAALGLPFSEACVHATLSMGVASYPDHGEAAEELLRAADRALYVSKGRGRNKVTLAEAELTHRS
ncbi:MAG: diguanylate cyclase, partial [Armatimonadetes bacterium]|nr:diguanylate cyclase [Armatimonadota bacterium]